MLRWGFIFILPNIYSTFFVFFLVLFLGCKKGAKKPGVETPGEQKLNPHNL
jgi:hypothetical protein